MDKTYFLNLLHNLPGWDNMTRKGGAGVVIPFKGVDFLIYRAEASHYLKYEPQTEGDVIIIKEFNALMEDCHSELTKELDEWNMVRLTRDDNEADTI